MPTECERNNTSPMRDQNSETIPENKASATNGNGSSSGTKISVVSPDPTPYVARARVTRPIPPKPSCNPMQFVQIKPCNLYQSAQQQLKKAEEVKKVKEIKKEEPEDWQNNLDNWKSSRRKRVEHIIDRVVEVKKFELEEYDRSRRKSKTFSEMIEERGERPGRGKIKLASLAVYNEDESNDFSDLGIGTSSASGKSSISEDYDNNSVISDNADIEKIFLDDTTRDDNAREYISSPGYDTSSSTAPASSPDPCEYTYEGAIQEYKTRVSRATSISSSNCTENRNVASDGKSNLCYKSNEATGSSTNDRNKSTIESFQSRRGSKIEDRLIGFEITSPNESAGSIDVAIKIDLPKIDIHKRKEVFENHNDADLKLLSNSVVNKMRTKQIDSNDVSKRECGADNLPVSETSSSTCDIRHFSGGDLMSIKERLQNFEQQNIASTAKSKTPQIDNLPVPHIKDRLSNLQNAATKEESKKSHVVLVDLHQLKRTKNMEEKEKLKLEPSSNVKQAENEVRTTFANSSTAKENDSGINISDHSSCTFLNNDDIIDHQSLNEHELSSNLSSSSNVQTNQTSDLYQANSSSVDNSEQSSDTNFALLNETSNEMEFSINEALELALDAIDKEIELPPYNNVKQNKNEEVRIIKHENLLKETTIMQHSDGDVKSSVIIPIAEPIYENITNSSDLPSVTMIMQPIFNNTTTIGSNNSNSLINCNSESIDLKNFFISSSSDEPYYQVPKSSEPYYETPKNLKPIPVYENIEMFHASTDKCYNTPIEDHLQSIAFKMEPPKEKPPPPPSESPSAYENDDHNRSRDNKSYCCDNWITLENPYETISDVTKHDGSRYFGNPTLPLKRMNSTKRIKKELRNKRSSFLGIDGSADDEENYLKIQMPPDMDQLLQEERRLEKQLYMKVGLCDSSDTGESRDSGVSENHSRQSSEPFTNSSEEADRTEEVIFKNSIITQICPESIGKFHDPVENSNAKITFIEEKIREQEEVLRVERELLQLEQEEIRRQRENLKIHENLARRELQHGAKMLMSASRRSLQDLNGLKIDYDKLKKQQIYANLPYQVYEVETDYRKSMSDLQDCNLKKTNAAPPIPPSKPMRQLQYKQKQQQEQQQQHTGIANTKTRVSTLPLNESLLVKIATQSPCGHEYPSYHPLPRSIPQLQTGIVSETKNDRQTSNVLHGNMTRNTLHTLSATPKPKYTDGWVHQKRKSFDSNNSILIPTANESGWLSSSVQQKRKSVPEGYSNSNSHWLVQEAEQRRLVEQKQNRNGVYGSHKNNISSGNVPIPQKTNKPLPDSIIQTLTERVQNKNIGDHKRFDKANSQTYQRNSLPNLGSLNIESTASSQQPSSSHKVLSVSGKKKCSHCGEELGRGAAMIIESLLLFYHINCFKCCVCHIQLGDGLNGTDVRVRNHKLHCQNCYSSDDGVKFSCV